MHILSTILLNTQNRKLKKFGALFVQAGQHRLGPRAWGEVNSQFQFWWFKKWSSNLKGVLIFVLRGHQKCGLLHSLQCKDRPVTMYWNKEKNDNESKLRTNVWTWKTKREIWLHSVLSSSFVLSVIIAGGSDRVCSHFWIKRTKVAIALNNYAKLFYQKVRGNQMRLFKTKSKRKMGFHKKSWKWRFANDWSRHHWSAIWSMLVFILWWCCLPQPCSVFCIHAMAFLSKWHTTSRHFAHCIVWTSCFGMYERK